MVVRLLVALVLLVLGASMVVFLVTRDRRYLIFAWQIVKFTVAILVVVGLLYVAERLILI